MDNHRVLIVDLYGGSCNRIRAYISCKLLARRTNRKLIIKWSIENPDMNAEMEDLFDIEVEKIDEMPEGKIFNFVTCPFDSQYSFLESLKSDSRIVMCDCLLHLRCYNDPGHTEFIKELRKIHGSFTNCIMDKVKTIQYKISLKGDERLVSLHWREWTDGMGDFFVQDILKKKSFSKEKKLIDFLKYMSVALRAYPETKFYIASDSKEMINYITSLDKFKGLIFSNDLEVISRKDTSGVIDGMVDWYILGTGNYIIGTEGSSFTELSSMLTREKRRISVGLFPWN